MTLEIKQMLVGSMAIFCYAVYDPEEKECALIDPAFETGKILSTVEKMGLKVTKVINTHAHPDHTSGNRAIIAATGAKLLIHKDEAKRLGGLVSKTMSKMMGGKSSPKADILIKDKSEIIIGKGKLEVIHTPGHTPGGICLYTPGHVITGDTLFVGGVGRTDLPGGSTEVLIKSIRKTLMTLPEDTRVWPGHHYGPKTYSTIGWEKTSNPFIM